MEIHGNRHFPRQTDLRFQLAVIGALAVGACLIGIGVSSAGSSSGVLIAGAAVAALLTAAAAWAVDIPLISFVRIGFIGSFFIKSDVSLFKVDEMEDPSGLAISVTLILGVVLLVYDRLNDESDERVFPPVFTFLLIALLVLSAASVLYAGPVLLGTYSLLSLFTSVLIAYVTASHFGRSDRIVFLITCLAVGVFCTGLVALSQYTIQWPLNLSYFGTGTEEEQLGTQSQELGRVPAFLRTPNGMAWVMSTLVPIVLAPVVCRVRSFSIRQKGFLTVAGLLGIIAVILSLARGSWIGLVAAMALLAAFGWIRLSRQERPGYFLSTAAMAVLVCVLLSPFAPRIYERLTEDDQGAAAVRIPLMDNALKMIGANPLVGIGLNNYRYSMTKYDETGIFVSQVFPNPVHNVFAHVTAEIGIPGGIIFCLLLLWAFWECVKSMTAKDRLLFALGLGAAVSLIAFAISGLKEPASLGSVRPPMRTCFLLLGTIMAFSRVRIQRSLSETQPR